MSNAQQQNTKMADAITTNFDTNAFKNIIKYAPLDLIRHSIFPSLDYESRIALNRCLDPCHRISTKISAEALDSHERYVCYHTLLLLLNKKKIYLNLTQQYKEAIKIFSLFKSPVYLNYISSEIKLRTNIMLKIEEFSQDIQNQDGVDISVKERLGRAIKAARIKIEKTAICTKIPVSPFLGTKCLK
jgi:hypothetical protein